MSGKLDQSLDDIVKTHRRKPGPRRNTRTRVVRSARTAGGVTKVTKAATTTTTKAAKPAVTAVPATGSSKIIVTGLPSDVTEQQIKDYFSKTIGPVKRVFLTYGPTGVSRGVATILFTHPNSAQEAATQLNGVKVDNRAMKIEVVVGANQALVPAKALGERIAPSKAAATTASKAKNQPRSAAAAAGASGKAAGKTAGGRAAKRAPRTRNAGRPKKKSAAELDAEMTDYFGGGAANAAAVNGAAAVPTSGDTGMDDEIL